MKRFSGKLKPFSSGRTRSVKNKTAAEKLLSDIGATDKVISKKEYTALSVRYYRF
jgi:ribosomal protein L20A (L18A)